MMVVVLEDAAEDIESGRRFYESCEAGVGDYFAESILSDLDSLALYAGYSSRLFWIPSGALKAIPIRTLL